MATHIRGIHLLFPVTALPNRISRVVPEICQQGFPYLGLGPETSRVYYKVTKGGLGLEPLGSSQVPELHDVYDLQSLVMREPDTEIWLGVGPETEQEHRMPILPKQ